MTENERNYDLKKEVNEAILAGEVALSSLYAAQTKLNSARNWGFVDMFGGGFVTNLIKHSQLGDATSLMEQAKRDLHRFQKELKDVRVPTDIRMEISDFLTFADFFFDGLIADYLVQSKIADARRQIDETISRVQELLNELKGL